MKRILRYATRIAPIALSLATPAYSQASMTASPDADAPAEALVITQAELEDKIYAAWLGQLVGNIYGLPHENVHIDEPGPDAFPYGYDFLEIPYYQTHFGSTKMTGVMDAFGGAFSDDDTDIEYIYLRMMEQHGLEPTYAQVRDAWMAHIDNWVWIANRQALAMMHEGFYPPYTGQEQLNPEFFQIDPQLINEIWAITAPGMVDYAVEKSRWAAMISADKHGTEPTIAYGAMFSAAFYEDDINRLIDIGAAALPVDSEFAQVIADMKALKERYPDDWRTARQKMAEAYYNSQPDPKSIWDANLNGACAILALLYGEGDFQKTLDLASAMGFDADNQAATLAGLIGLAKGTKAIPHDLLYPIKGWELPFNDRYLNRSRRDMPSASITDLAHRTALLAEQMILAKGGSKHVQNGLVTYTVNPTATFVPPFELSPLIPKVMLSDRQENILLSMGDQSVHWQATGLPTGLSLSETGLISGATHQTGRFDVTITATRGEEHRTQNLPLIIKGANLAPDAAEVFGPADRESLSHLRDGVTYGGNSVESPKAGTRVESFGYRWDKPQTISSLLLTTGRMGENGGWFASMSAEYLSADGSWHAIPGVTMTPEPVLQNDKHLRPHYADYLIEFPAITTEGIRVKGLNGGEGDKRYMSLSELSVFE